MGIEEDSMELVFKDRNDRLVIYWMFNGQYLTFLRSRNTPVVGYLMVDLLPPKFVKRVWGIIGRHQQQLQDRAFKLLEAQHGHSH